MNDQFNDDAMPANVSSADATSADAANDEANSRRTFLRQGAIATGGLVLGLAGAACADDAASPAASTGPADLVLKLKEHGELSRVGGYEIIETKDEKIIVAHTGENSFVACSASCPHRGCPVEYHHDTKEFVCPCHNSRFDMSGKVLRGPSKQPLKSYSADTAAIVGISPKNAG